LEAVRVFEQGIAFDADTPFHRSDLTKTVYIRQMLVVQKHDGSLINVLTNGGDSSQSVDVTELRIASDLHRTRHLTDHRLETVHIGKGLVFQHVKGHSTPTFSNRSYASKAVDICQMSVVRNGNSTAYGSQGRKPAHISQASVLDLYAHTVLVGSYSRDLSKPRG
jgi:hypothetical protein